jgi:Flp pilus assembly protein TadG
MKRMARGQDLVEFSLVVVMLFALLAAIFDLGRAVIAYNILQNAVREGARYAAVNYNTTAANVDDAIRRRTMLLNQSRLTINAPQWNFNTNLYKTDPLGALRNATVVVSATYEYRPFFNVLIKAVGASSTLRAQSTMRMEQFAPTPTP